MKTSDEAETCKRCESAAVTWHFSKREFVIFNECVSCVPENTIELPPLHSIKWQLKNFIVSEQENMNSPIVFE